MSSASPQTAVPHDAQSGADALDRFGCVTNETKRDLQRFVALLAEWQCAHNLVSPATLDAVWERHVADSLQLVEHAPPDFREWVDLGSGAGFPGLVVAIAGKDRPERHFTLVESNGKKAAFLNAAIRATGANATVANERIESFGAKMARRGDVISARALKPLPELLQLAQPYCREDSVILALKGRDYAQNWTPRLSALRSMW